MMTLPETSRPPNILLVEDNPADVQLTRQAFRRGALAPLLYAVENGEQALAFLRHEGDFANVPRPDLILLDLNMPLMDGREVLSEIKSDLELCLLPVLILTTSQNAQDIADAYRLHANAYIAKPLQMARFRETIQAIEQFWLAAALLPSVR